ncbi:MAG: aminotransferase class III-fold pyridoxal phosphate-dependent enzyme [Treponema sp.]|jgi:glutamate-1-semialdehyde 2,1-aminomutase|nr:aminotransferase class III-fold pyridoxal phosphate-dependent enzyme [Treponema sp.]
MAFRINSYEKSAAEYRRALRVIPSGVYGHQGPAEGCFVPVTAFPFFSDRARGSYFWDVDGNRFIDYMGAYGPNVLGYNDPEVDEAAARQRADGGDCITAPSTRMIDLAELLVDTVASADWAFFAKNGGDATTLGVMTARAYTRRKKIVFFKGYYHGVAPWAQKIDYPGIIPEDVSNNLYVPWNDYGRLAEVFAQNRGQIAAVISQPYWHGNFADNELPAPGFWARVRKLCTDTGAVLILDDVRTGFRLDLAGSDHFFGFEADLICFCKAIANGYNLSALCGKEAFRNTLSGLSYTGSYWLSAVPFAAGIACINKMKRLDLPRLLDGKGKKLTDGLRAAAAKHGYDLRVSGMPALFYLRLVDAGELPGVPGVAPGVSSGPQSETNETPALLLHQRWIAGMVQRGIYLTNHHNHFINYALSDEDIDTTIAVADEVFASL